MLKRPSRYVLNKLFIFYTILKVSEDVVDEESGRPNQGEFEVFAGGCSWVTTIAYH